MYLPESAVVALLRWVAGHRSTRTSIVFDVCWAEGVDGSREYFGGRELRRNFAAIGEPLRWGIPEGQIDETLAQLGLRVEVAYEPADLVSRYLTRQDGSTLGRPFGFFVIVHARATREPVPRETPASTR
jgi:O-methyltransferase involved in polyketide biosynthesis